MYKKQSLSHLTLGKKTDYTNQYNPQLLQAVPRALNRDSLGITEVQPFCFGADLWTAFELSWLNLNGVPQVAIAEVSLDYQSENLIESKSFKLYLNSFNQSHFETIESIQNTLEKDLSECAKGKVSVAVKPLKEFNATTIQTFDGENIDDQNIIINDYQFNPELLENCTENGNIIEETLTSDLLKSNCLITNQPDWGSVQIHYVGEKINREALLHYIVSFREHNEFHEQCVERIYCDIMRFAQPQKLTVYARYTRRGGLDINPFRSNFENVPENIRLARQ